MPRIALTGGTYQARSVIASAQRCLNLVPEPMPRDQGEPAPAAHYPTPGLTLLSTLPEAPVRGIRQATTGGIYAVAGSGIYRVDPTTWAGTLIGHVTAGRTNPVSMADNGLDMIVVDGSTNGWDITLTTDVVTLIPTTNVQTPVTASTTAAIVAGTARYTPFTASISGSVSTASVSLGTGYTGQLQCAIFADASGVPGASTGFVADVITNPVAGSNPLNFQTPVVMAAGTQYWLGCDSDTSAGDWSVATGTTGFSSSTAFADFPADSPAVSAAAAVVCTLTVSNDAQGFFSGADKVDYLDTYFIFNKPGTPQFYISGSLAITFDRLDFSNKESYSDLLVTLIVAKRELYLLGDHTTEIWYDAGTTDIGAGSFPFAEMWSVFIDHGTVAKYSAASYDNTIFWLTRNRQGNGVVMQAAGYQTKRLSTFAIEHEIAGYAVIDDAIGFTYQMAGHTFYVLTFPLANHTWVYDVQTGLWHEWCWIDVNGTEHRHRANCFWPCDGTLVVGDWQNGNLYALDNNVFTDFGGPIKRVRAFPHVLADARRVFYREFVADLETGTSASVAVGPATPLDATFTAADGTLLEDYTSDVGWGWTPITAGAEIEGDVLVGTGGATLYQSDAIMFTADYSVQFDVVPPAYDSVLSGTTMYAIGRGSTGGGGGYRASVSADGTQYTFTLDAPGTSVTPQSVAMGTLASGVYTVWLKMFGTFISAAVQRTEDALWLSYDGTWRSVAGSLAAWMTDTTYAAPGSVFIGGTWPSMRAIERTAPSGFITLPLGTDYYQGAVYGISADGKTACGWVSPPGSLGFQVSCYWTSASGNWSDAAGPFTITDPNPDHDIYGSANGVSGDGSIIVGSALGIGPFKWTVADGLVPLESGPSSGVAFAISADGSRIAGYMPDGLNYQAAYWNSVSLVRTDLGFLPGDDQSQVLAVSTDGSAMVGFSQTSASDSEQRAFRWTAATGMVDLGAPIGVEGVLTTKANGISGDGALVVGDYGTAGTGGSWQWTATDGMLEISMLGANAVSGDGSTILGGAPFDSPYPDAMAYLTRGSAMVPIPVALDPAHPTSIQVTSGSAIGSDGLTMAGTGAPTAETDYLPFIYGPPAPPLAMDNVSVAAVPPPLPLVSLDWSDDRGHSFGNPVTQSMGRAGQYRTSPQWQRLGFARDRVFRLSWSTATATALQGAWITAEPADSNEPAQPVAQEQEPG